MSIHEISAKTVCHCPVVLPTADGGAEMYFQGLWYEDKLVRTVDGWKISKRAECNYFHNTPAGFQW